MALLDYLAHRRGEIETQIKALRAELAEIKIAEAALTGTPVAKTVVSSGGRGAVVREGSIKDWVLKALAVHDIGLDTEALIAAVAEIGGPTIPRSSMTPQLSRLKAAGLLHYEDGLWQLPPQNNETPSVGAPGVPKSAEDLDIEDLLG